MTDRRLAIRDAEAVAASDPSVRRQHSASSRLAERRGRGPRTRLEVEAEYEAARDAWTQAMRVARSGKPADLAALAMAQEAYEAALAEKHRWDGSPRAAIPVESDRPRGIDAIVGQELARRRLHDVQERQHQQKPKGLRGIWTRLSGR